MRIVAGEFCPGGRDFVGAIAAGVISIPFFGEELLAFDPLFDDSIEQVILLGSCHSPFRFGNFATQCIIGVSELLISLGSQDQATCWIVLVSGDESSFISFLQQVKGVINSDCLAQQLVAWAIFFRPDDASEGIMGIASGEPIFGRFFDQQTVETVALFLFASIGIAHLAVLSTDGILLLGPISVGITSGNGLAHGIVASFRNRHYFANGWMNGFGHMAQSIVEKLRLLTIWVNRGDLLA